MQDIMTKQQYILNVVEYIVYIMNYYMNKGGLKPLIFVCMCGFLSRLPQFRGSSDLVKQGDVVNINKQKVYQALPEHPWMTSINMHLTI